MGMNKNTFRSMITEEKTLNTGDKPVLGGIYRFSTTLNHFHLRALHPTPEDYIENGITPSRKGLYTIESLHRDLEQFHRLPAGKRDYMVASFEPIDIEQLPIEVWLNEDGSLPPEFTAYYELFESDLTMRDLLWWI